MATIAFVAVLLVSAAPAGAAPGDAVLASHLTPLDAAGADLELSADATTAYLSIPDRSHIAVVDVATSRVIDRIDVPGRPVGLDLDPAGGVLWAALRGTASVAAIDLQTDSIEIYELPGLGHPRTFDVAATDRGIFVSADPGSSGIAQLVRLTPATRAVDVVASGRIVRGSPSIGWNGGDSLWVTESAFSPQSVYRLDLTDPTVPIVDEDDHSSGLFGTEQFALLADDAGIVVGSGHVLDANVTPTRVLRGAGRPTLEPGGSSVALLDHPGERIRRFDIATGNELGELRLRSCPGRGIEAFTTIGSMSYLILSGSVLCTVTAGAGGTSAARCDVDADGYGDAVLGNPGRRVAGRENAGAVVILRGGRAGLRAAGALELTVSTAAGSGRPRAQDLFGFSSQCADFDGDGYDDLAVGVPGRQVRGRASAGAVILFPGSSRGVDPNGAKVISRATRGVPGPPGAGHLFGVGLAAGDVNGDGFDDLAVGAPGEPVAGATRAGTITILLGSADGLRPRSSLVVSQQDPGLGERPEADDRFGADPVIGDVDQDGFADLVVGMPFEGIGREDEAGLIHVLWGGPTGVSTVDAVTIDQESSLPGSSDAEDRFGESVAIGDHDGDGRVDLLVGVPGDDGRGSRLRDRGAVVSIPAGPEGIDTQRSRRVAVGRCGSCLAAITIDHAVLDRLAGPSLLVGVGFAPYSSRPGPLPATGEIMIHTGRSRETIVLPRSVVQPGALFGVDLAAEDTDGDGDLEILATAPGYDLAGGDDAGVLVEIHLERPRGRSRFVLWHRDVRGVPGEVRPGEFFPSLAAV